MNTPTIITDRLILRKFTEQDLEALFLILKDEEVNKFLPWYPMKNIEETRKFYEERYASKYAQPQAYAYAICLKEDNYPIGYIKVDMEEHHDFGYGLRKEFWHKGIVTEAGKAVIEQVKKDGLPYITATHDRNNPRSGGVMQNVGMKYQYSYEEQWQPKMTMISIFVSLETILPHSEATIATTRTARGPPALPSSLAAAPTAIRENNTSCGVFRA